jgi:hypothetical protein
MNQYLAIQGISAFLSSFHVIYPSALWPRFFHYAGASVWILTDLVFSSVNDELFQRVFFLNIFMIGAWIVYPDDFQTSLHIISIIKCLCVLNLLSNFYKFRSSQQNVRRF